MVQSTNPQEKNYKEVELPPKVEQPQALLLSVEHQPVRSMEVQPN